MERFDLDRRQVLGGLIALSAVGGLAACRLSTDETGSDVAPPDFFVADEMVLIAAIAQTIIPKTDTAGAIEAGVPETLQEVASVWSDDDYREHWRDGLGALGESLTDAKGTAFVDLSAQERDARLSEYDTVVFAGETQNDFYKDFKATVIEAYYMSEAGASEELAYVAVPGEAIPCAPLSEYPKAWAT